MYMILQLYTMLSSCRVRILFSLLENKPELVSSDFNRYRYK